MLLQSAAQLSFELDQPGLLVYTIYNDTASVNPTMVNPPAPFQIGNGRVPVFAAASLGSINITACGNYSLLPSSSYLVQYYIRDKYGETQTDVFASTVRTGS